MGNLNSNVSKLHYYCQLDDLKEVVKIIKKQDLIESRDKYTRTPLATALRYGNINIAKYLVSKGANLNAVNCNGTTMLMYAKTSVLNSQDFTILEWMIDLGANINAEDKYRKTVLDYVEELNQIDLKNFLISKGAKTSTKIKI